MNLIGGSATGFTGTPGCTGSIGGADRRTAT
jgi:hypothetical protein